MSRPLLCCFCCWAPVFLLFGAVECVCVCVFHLFCLALLHPLEASQSTDRRRRRRRRRRGRTSRALILVTSAVDSVGPPKTLHFLWPPPGQSYWFGNSNDKKKIIIIINLNGENTFVFLTDDWPATQTKVVRSCVGQTANKPPRCFAAPPFWQSQVG